MLPVEQALSTPSSGHHPWRTIAVVAAGIATLELLGLVAAGTALLAKPVAKAARAEVHKTAPAPKKAPARPLLPRGSVSVTVLNGNGVAGAAATMAQQVRARGYVIGQVGNAPRSGYGRTVVMYRIGRRPEALRLARDLGIRVVSPLDGLKPRDLMGAQVAVVVGA
jgi:LytR cell envelope-related transcriptional attenuator